jgi:DNA repair protein RadC
MQKLSSGEDVDQYIRESIDLGLINHKEFFWIIPLTRSNHILGLKEISNGKTDSTTISFKEIAQAVILSNACACILVHNHPSGSLSPSRSDKAITKKAQDVFNLIEVTLLDHVIITQEGFYSFAENGLITQSNH